MKADQFLTLLKVPATLAGKQVTDERRIRAMNARLIGLGFGVNCSRCGGSGHYSFNQVTGTTCFKCNGARFEAPKLTRELYARVSDTVASGALDAYLANVRERQAAEKAAKGATDAVMKAWQAQNLGAVYDWHKCSSDPYHREIADRVNKPMCDAFDRVSTLYNVVDSLTYRLNGGGRNSKPLTAEERAALETERAQALADLITGRDSALEIIEKAGALIPEIRARHKV
jgi:hypothetical protein